MEGKVATNPCTSFPLQEESEGLVLTEKTTFPASLGKLGGTDLLRLPSAEQGASSTEAMQSWQSTREEAA